MKGTSFDRKWTRADALRSFSFFMLHFVIWCLIAGGCVLSQEFANLGTHVKTNGANYLYALFSTFLILVVMYFYFYFGDRTVLTSGRDITKLFAILDVYFLFAYFIGLKTDIYARPVALVALLSYVLIGKREAMFMNIISAFLLFVVDTFTGTVNTNPYEYYSCLLISFTAGMIAVFFCGHAKTRFAVVGIGILIVLPMEGIICLLEISNVVGGKVEVGTDAFQDVLLQMGYGVLGGILSAVIFLAVLPFFEWIFNCLTIFRLREITSPDARVLKKLKSQAPGTYNHAVMVAQLAEASAAAIDEDVDSARAAALYHDVGKLHNPEHFTENQQDYNLHDELTPELSADIIRSHAQDGYRLIKNNHLPDFLADVALQHHGTMPIRYFYAKALKMTDGELNIEDFSYLGPKPQTKIAAIVMIADAAEAAVRSLHSRSPEETEKAVRGVIEERMDLEQFSECDITLADLTKIRAALVDTLSGVYHRRIKYPNIKYRKSADGKTKGEGV